MPVSHNHRLLVPALALLSLLIAHAARATEGLVLGNTHALLTGLIFIAQERVLSLRLFHRPFPRVFPGGKRSISHIDHPDELIREAGLMWEA